MTESDLANYFVSQFSLDPAAMSMDTPLFSSGRLDSFHLLDVIAHLESVTGSRVRAGEVSLENFDTISRLAAFVARKQAGAQP